MRQEVQATVTITYDADASLSRKALKEQVHDDIVRLLDADSGSHIEAANFTILSIREEAEIYAAASLPDERVRVAREALVNWALDKASTHHRLAHENEHLRAEHIASSAAYRELAEQIPQALASLDEGEGR